MTGAVSAPRVAVIGAGPAGMTAAYLLARRGIPVEVFEKAGSVGGLARARPAMTSSGSRQSGSGDPARKPP